MCRSVSNYIQSVSLPGFSFDFDELPEAFGALPTCSEVFKSTILTAVVAFLAYYSNFVKFFFIVLGSEQERGTGLAGMAGIRMFKGYVCVYMTLLLLPTH